MVFDATGKYIHSTRYRQIVETASHEKLNDNEQGAISEDQKHSSVVARVHYQKRRSRDENTRVSKEITRKQGGTTRRRRLSSSSKSSNSSSDHEQSSESLRKDTKRPEGGVHLRHSSNAEVKSSEGQKKKALLFTVDEDKFLGEGIKLYGFGQW